jgi:hypothetical protein
MTEPENSEELMFSGLEIYEEIKARKAKEEEEAKKAAEEEKNKPFKLQNKKSEEGNSFIIIG